MPPVGDSDYIPRKDWASAAKQWFKDDLEAKRRLERTQAQLEPLRGTLSLSPVDILILADLGILPD